MQRIHALYCDQTEEQREHDILFHGACDAPEDQQVKWDFGNQSQKQQPAAVCAHIPRMRIALNKQKAVDREGEAADAAERADGREKRKTGVIRAHAQQRKQTQRKRRQAAHPSCYSTDSYFYMISDVRGVVNVRHNPNDFCHR